MNALGGVFPALSLEKGESVLVNVGQFQDAMRAVLDTMKNMQTLDRQVTIRSAMNAKNREELAELAQALAL